MRNLLSLLTLSGLSLLTLHFVLGVWISGTQSRPSVIEKLPLYAEQAKWLQRGDRVQGAEVITGLGVLTIRTVKGRVFAPFKGKVTLGETACALFTTPDLPDYKFRLCDLSNVVFGAVAQGQVIGQTDLLKLSALKKVGSTWAIVETPQSVLERLLVPNVQK